MAVMYIAWMILKRPTPPSAFRPESPTTPISSLSTHDHDRARRWQRPRWLCSDLVDVNVVDLVSDEYEEGEVVKADDDEREGRVQGMTRVLWQAYYWVV